MIDRLEISRISFKHKLLNKKYFEKWPAQIIQKNWLKASFHTVFSITLNKESHTHKVLCIPIHNLQKLFKFDLIFFHFLKKKLSATWLITLHIVLLKRCRTFNESFEGYRNLTSVVVYMYWKKCDHTSPLKSCRITTKIKTFLLGPRVLRICFS